jgi:uncharacterized protein YrrD
MRKGSQVIGTPVVTFDTGESIEKIKDIIFDQHDNRVLALLVDEGGWLSSARIVPWDEVQAVGPDAIIIPSIQTISRAESVPLVKEILNRNNVTKGTKIVTTDGRDLGTIADLFFDEDSGAVNGYEVSGGLFADAMSGRSFVPAPQTLQIGEDVAFVPPETADQMEEQVGGIKGAANKVQENVKTTADKAQGNLKTTVEKGQEAARDAAAKAQESAQAGASQAQESMQSSANRLKEMTAEASQKAQESYEKAMEGGSSASQQQLDVDDARGRRVQTMVTTSEGRIIAAPGQIVSDPVISSARANRMEDELLVAVGLQSAAPPGQSAGAMAGDRINEAATKVTESTKSTLDRLRERLSENQQKARDESQERAIKRALGRPTTRVILDRDDDVILDTGELITNEAIERARQAGVLDILTSSVYMKEPEIPEGALHANQVGEASLENDRPGSDPPVRRLGGEGPGGRSNAA